MLFSSLSTTRLPQLLLSGYPPHSAQCLPPPLSTIEAIQLPLLGIERNGKLQHQCVNGDEVDTLEGGRHIYTTFPPPVSTCCFSSTHFEHPFQRVKVL